MDGYDTCESEVEEADPQAHLDEEMDVDSEEESKRLKARSPMNASVRCVKLRPDFRDSIEFYISLDRS